MYNLASAVSNQGKYQEAEQLYQQTLALRTDILLEAPSNPTTLRSIMGVANVVSQQGNYQKAEQLYRQTLELQTGILGAEHPDTLRSMMGIRLRGISTGKLPKGRAALPADARVRPTS